MTTAIIGGKVYTPGEVFEPGVVLITEGKIAAVAPQGEVSIPPETEIIDATSKSVVPGFIDVHIHGLLGHDAMGPGLAEVISALPAYGTTSFMATTLTYPQEEIIAALREMAEVLVHPAQGARCLGIHLEGPHLSPARPGMATSEWLYPLTWEEFEVFQQAAGGHIGMITFAPETGEAMATIPRLIEAGVTPVIGHSDATFTQVEEAVRLGLNHATHTYNAMRPLHHREPGVVGAILHFDEIYAQLVADGVHVHPVVMNILLRIKGLDRVVLVSDASPLAGLPDGEYEWEHKPVYVRNRTCQLADGTIAGAHALMDTGVRNLVYKVGLPLEQALIPATRSAARSLGIKTKGQIAAEFDADIVLLNQELFPVMTMVEGQVVWQREA